jgi:hypothetical protein
MKPPADLWAIIVDLGLQEAFPPQCILFAMNAYARAVGACEEFGHPYRTIRVEVIGRMTSLQFSFDGSSWQVYRLNPKQRARTPMVGRAFLEREDEPQITLEEVVFTGDGERYMITRNKYYMGYLRPDNTWKIEQGDDLFHLTERFKQVTNITSPPKEVRLYMDSVHPDGTKYEHDIAKFSR